jgi:hypothetical protein
MLLLAQRSTRPGQHPRQAVALKDSYACCRNTNTMHDVTPVLDEVPVREAEARHPRPAQARPRSLVVLAWVDAVYRKAIRVRAGRRQFAGDPYDTFPRQASPGEAARIAEILERRLVR